MEEFLRSVLQRSEDLMTKNNGVSSENYSSELLVHTELLGQTVQLLHDIGNIPTLKPEDVHRKIFQKNIHDFADGNFRKSHSEAIDGKTTLSIDGFNS